MRQFVRSLPVAAIAAIAVFAAVATLRSQDNSAGSTWEYATVLGYSTGAVGGDSYRPVVSGNAQICFVSASGCRYDAVQASNDLNQEVRNSAARNYNPALAKAAARLGSEGWELTNTVAVGQDASTIQMYFRKPLTHQ